MIGHLGSRVSALLDGQLPPAEAERAWAHVHSCHTCRDAVEREGWVKTRLAGLSLGATSVPDHLKGSLTGSPGIRSPGLLRAHPAGHHPAVRRHLGLAIGGGAVGAAVVGVLALGVAPSDGPGVDRRPPTTSFLGPTDAPLGSPPAPAGTATP